MFMPQTKPLPAPLSPLSRLIWLLMRTVGRGDDIPKPALFFLS